MTNATINSNVKVEVKRARFGEFKVYENSIPEIEIILDDNYVCNRSGKTKIIKRSGWLSAFRNCCFQVSRTFDGDGDCGSSPVFGLDTFKSIQQCGCSNLSQESTIKFMIAAAAYTAINAFVDNKSDSLEQVIKMLEHDDSDEEAKCTIYKAPKNYFTNFVVKEERVEFEKFIYSCYKKYVLNESPVLTEQEIEDIETGF